MVRISYMLLLLILFSAGLAAQNKPIPGKTVITNAIKEIKAFQEKERKQDSLAGKPLGSYTEAAFLRRFDFYRSVYAKLNKIDRAKLALSDQVNLELLQYILKDEVSQYQFKAYLNPILSDEGFHTSLADLGREVLTTEKEFADYIKKLKDIPRFVNENIELMRTGLQAGISQPGLILNGYENTYEQH